MVRPRTLAFLALPLFLAALLTGSAVAQDRRDYAAFYVGRYGEVAAIDDPRVARAEAVFQRVLAAADKKANRFPRLVMLQSGGEPWALSLPDGSVLVTQGALRICYEGAEAGVGDARIAFVFGHELAHLAKDDFWHRPAFAAVRRHLGADDELGRLRESASDLRQKELQADSYGVVSMAMAGYDPGVVLSDGDGGFFEHWAAEVLGPTRRRDRDPTHHTPRERADFLRAQLQRVVDHLVYFRFGVRLYQIGSYEDALALFSEYRKEFPGREVFNNIGLTHYQLALESLAACDPAAARAFRPALSVDLQTTEAVAGLRGPSAEGIGGDPCREAREGIREELGHAVRNLQFAADRDPAYLPARLNLSAALILLGRHSEALGVLDQALAAHPGDPAARINKAVAFHLFGKANAVAAGDRALELLGEAEAAPAFRAQAIYNRAAVLQDLGRAGEARAAWQRYLQVEPLGAYAAGVRERLSEPPPPPMRRTAGGPSAPVVPGVATATADRALAGLETHSFTLGTLSGAVARRPGLRVLVLGSRVEMVEEDLPRPRDAEELRREYGEPERTLVTAQGRTWVFGTFAADVVDGMVRRLVHF